MRYLSAQYVFTNAGPPLKRALVIADDDGTIRSVEDTNGNLPEKGSLEFFNGIIIPGFVNCHCHLELSHMKGMIAKGSGLPGFLKEIRLLRESDEASVVSAAETADAFMWNEGVVLCADICNNHSTFSLKKKSRIKYVNLLEVFGIDPDKALKRMDEVLELSQMADLQGLTYWMVPHTLYSMSLPLLSLLKMRTSSNRVTSIHFMESVAEEEFLRYKRGPILESYKETGLATGLLQTVPDPVSGIIEWITPSGNLILVHNTFADRITVNSVRKRENAFFCLCPNSNLFIENKLPPLEVLVEEKCDIVIGTDSLASNSGLSILNELRTIQQFFPSIKLEELIKWATLNGARALGESTGFGSISPGTKPGLLLIEDIDLQNMKLLPESRVRFLC
ncbi:MAG: amidohydrolase family protein [Bacteroidota bacterium]|nr:amidohydrolase family protein [Bacteroidota bacterium]